MVVYLTYNTLLLQLNKLCIDESYMYVLFNFNYFDIKSVIHIQLVLLKLFQHNCKLCTYNWSMHRISGTWHDSLTVNITVEEFCHYRKKKKSCPWLLNNRASDCWTIVPVTVEQSCQWLLKNHASDCWTIVPVTVEPLYQRLLRNREPLLNNHASDCWTIVPVNVE